MNLTTNPGSSDLARSPELGCELSIVIVSWNVRDMLRDCLRSIEQQNTGGWAEVVLVDNASSDSTCEMVHQEFPWVRLIDNPRNLGFAPGNNLALQSVRGEFVLLLNPDTVVYPGTLRKMVEFARANPSFGIVGPKQFDRNGKILFEAGVDFPSIWNVLCDLMMLSVVFPRSRLFAGRKMGYWDHLDDREVPAISGAAMLLRKSVLDRVGLLDETMFCVEDIDLCSRVRRDGIKVYYMGSAPIVHYVGGSRASSNAGLQRQIAFQSLWLYLHKSRGSLSPMVLSVVVFFWALLAWPATFFAARMIPSGEGKARLDFLSLLAKRLLQWSLMDKSKFRHHLAKPPSLNKPDSDHSGNIDFPSSRPAEHSRP
jgi:GT2 family glycosyltransferase